MIREKSLTLKIYHLLGKFKVLEDKPENPHSKC